MMPTWYSCASCNRGIKVPLLVNPNQALLFIHAPKCGGSSVVDTFECNGYEIEFQIRGKPPQNYLKVSPQHQTCSTIKSLVRLENISNVFIVTRSPYDRIQSEYNWTFRNVPKEKRMPYNEWVLSSLAKASVSPSYADNHFLPIVDFLDVDIPTEIFRLEDGLELIYEYYIQMPYSVHNIPTFHRKKSSSFQYVDKTCTLDVRALEAVNEFYKLDFLAFDYEQKVANKSYLVTESTNMCTAQISQKIKKIKSWRINTIKLLFEKLKIQRNFLFSKLSEMSDSILEETSSENCNTEKEIEFLQANNKNLFLRTELMCANPSTLANKDDYAKFSLEISRTWRIINECRLYISQLK